jgi:universal stress protein E
MTRMKSLLVIVDPTAQEHPAVAKAALLATKFAAHLELYACDTRAARETRFTAAAVQGKSGSDAVPLRTFLEKLAQPLRERGLDVSTEVEFSESLAAQLVDRTRCSSADMVIKDTHHHSLAHRTFLGNTDWELIRGCPLPLLLTKSASWAQAPQIVAAIDPFHLNDKPADLDRQILEQASGLASGLGGRAHALHAYIPVAVVAAAVATEPGTALAASPQEIKQERQHRLEDLAQVTAPYSIASECLHVEPGGPIQVLPDAARELHADVMVMGALSRRGLKRIFIGSTAEDVLERLPCDALIVKPPDFSEALQGLCSAGEQ